MFSGGSGDGGFREETKPPGGESGGASSCNHDGRISWQSSYINIMYYVFCILSIFIFIFILDIGRKF